MCTAVQLAVLLLLLLGLLKRCTVLGFSAVQQLLLLAAVW
jgi:hypothetical protein